MAGPEDQTRDLNTSQTEHLTDLVSLSQAILFTWGKWLKIPIIFTTDEYSTIRHLSCNMTKPTKWPMHPAKTQISMGIRLVWSESLLYTWRNLGSLATCWAHSEGSEMPSLIWVFAGHMSFVGFVVLWFKPTLVNNCIFQCQYIVFTIPHHRNIVWFSGDIAFDVWLWWCLKTLVSYI